MTKFTTRSGLFHIDEHGNGWAYTVTQQATGGSFFVQDEAASQLQTDCADFTDESVLTVYMDAIGS